MPYNTEGIWVPEDDSVSTRLTGLLGKNNPLMTQARTMGLQGANRRGLLNSSIAVGAAQNEAIKAALPVASQEAQQIHQKNLGQMDIASRERVATQNVAAHDRQYLISALTEAQKKYGAMFTEIVKNNDLSQSARNTYYQHLSALRDTDLDLLRQIYNVDFDWESAVATHA